MLTDRRTKYDMIEQKKDFFWNTFAGFINAAEAVVMSIIVTRFGKLSDAGILSLAFAVGNVLMTVGRFGGRLFQITDTQKQYSFRMYIIQRFITLVLMVISLVTYLLYRGYMPDKRNVIIIIAFIYMVETIEDCFWGYYQAEGRLYLGAQMFSSRWVIMLVVFAIGMVITHNLTTTLFLSAGFGLVIFLFWLVYFLKNEVSDVRFAINSIVDKNTLGCLKKLFIQTFPLFLAYFCSIFINSLPKFAIDRYLNDEIQACYGFVVMPVFVIGLLNQFIYQPTIVPLTNEYYENKIDVFQRNVRKHVFVVMVIATLCIIGAALIGVPVLSSIYHTDLSDYWKELVILQMAGAFLAISGYFTVLLTLMRRQKIILIGYVCVLIIGTVVINWSVRVAGTIGASISYLLVVVSLVVFYYYSYRRVLVKLNRNSRAL